MLNKAILMGRLTRDPELRYTPNGNVPVCRFSIAVERSYSGADQQRATDFIDIAAWRRTAEFISQWFTKGMMIVVIGSIQTRRWQDKNGNNRVSVEVLADEVQFGESKKSRERNVGAAQPQQNHENTAVYAANEDHYTDSDFGEFADDDGQVPF